MRNSQFFCRVIFAYRFCVYSSPLCHFYIRYNVLPTEYGKLKLRLLTEHAYFAHLLLSQHSQNQYLICSRAAGDAQDTVQPFAGTYDELLINVCFEKFHAREIGGFESRKFFRIEIEAVG